jgi:hypothetical protein
MRIMGFAAVAAAFIAGICMLSTDASAGNLGPKAKLSGADPIYGSMQCTGGRCALKGSGGGSGKTCSAFAARCAMNLGESPRCASARAHCMRTGVYAGPSGRVFHGMLRQ